jgi:hypothetical protein
MTARGTLLSEIDSFSQKVKHPSFDALARVSDGFLFSVLFLIPRQGPLGLGLPLLGIDGGDDSADLGCQPQRLGPAATPARAAPGILINKAWFVRARRNLA